MKTLRELWRAWRGIAIENNDEVLSRDDLMLREILLGAREEPALDHRFTASVLREHRLRSRRQWVGYWAPAAVAAGIAAMAFFAMLQSLTSAPDAPSFKGQEARLVNERTIFPDPRLEMNAR